MRHCALPAFFYNYEFSVFGVLAFLVGILSGSALLTWLYNGTGGGEIGQLVYVHREDAHRAVTAGAQQRELPAALSWQPREQPRKQRRRLAQARIRCS